MNAAVDRMEVQLRLWLAQIDRRSARMLVPGYVPGFEELTRIDILKALHVIAQAKCDEFRAAGAADKPRLASELTGVWDELAVTIRKPCAIR